MFNLSDKLKEDYNEVLKDASEFLSKIELDNSNIILYNNSVILKKYVDKTNLITLIKVLYDKKFNFYSTIFGYLCRC